MPKAAGFAIFCVVTLSLAFVSPWFATPLIFYPFLFFFHELVQVPKFFTELTSQYDSVSRFIYSGSGSYGAADFHLKIAPGKIKTIELHQVADEVRTLSGRTHQATEQIKQSIFDIQTTLLSLSKTMLQGNESATECVKKAGESQNIIQKVNNAISDISDLTTQISSASEQQSIVTESTDTNNNVKTLASLGLTFG